MRQMTRTIYEVYEAKILITSLSAPSLASSSSMFFSRTLDSSEESNCFHTFAICSTISNGEAIIFKESQ